MPRMARLVGALAALWLAAGANTAGAADADVASPKLWYLGLSAGPQWRGKASDTAGETTFDTGFAANVFLGRRLYSFRAEAEFSYLVNDLATTDPAGPVLGKEESSGDADVRALFLNVYYERPIGSSNIKAYVGGGVGGHKVSINGLTTPSLRTLPPEFGGPVVVYADSTWAFAYQLRAGASHAFTESWELYLGYRYLKGMDLDINLADGSTIHPDVEVHGVELGIRLSF